MNDYPQEVQAQIKHALAGRIVYTIFALYDDKAECWRLTQELNRTGMYGQIIMPGALYEIRGLVLTDEELHQVFVMALAMARARSLQ